MNIEPLFGYVLVGILLLTAASGGALFYKAAIQSQPEGRGQGTLWGLFIIGLAITLLLVILTYTNHH